MRDDVENRVCKYTTERIKRILGQDDSPRKAVLAKLRRGVGRTPGALPELWGEILMDWERYFPDDGEYVKDVPTYKEWAVYTALTMFALHQQGHDPKKHPMHEKGACLGMAVRRLVKDQDDQDDIDRVWRRFSRLATVDDMFGTVHYLRNLIQMLRNESIGLDYADLAIDLYRYQFGGESADNVRMKWGRNFFRRPKLSDKNDPSEEAASDDQNR